MTSFDFGDVLLVPFPFTDQTQVKRRPAVVVSSTAFHHHRSDVIVAAITSRAPTALFGEVSLAQWQEAGLQRPSTVKPVLTSLSLRLVVRKLGRLTSQDLQALREILPRVVGG